MSVTRSSQDLFVTRACAHVASAELSFSLEARRYIRLGYDPREVPEQSDGLQSPAWNQPVQIKISSAFWSVLSKRHAKGPAPSVCDSSVVADEVGLGDHDPGVCEAVDIKGDDGVLEANSANSSDQKPWLEISPEDALLAPPSFRSFSIILKNARHPLFLEWKTNAKPLAAYDYNNGWFTSEALDSVRVVVERCICSLLTDEESRALAAFDKDHSVDAFGRRGRLHTLHHHKRTKRGRGGLQRIEQLSALAPVAGHVAGAATAEGSRSRQPAVPVGVSAANAGKLPEKHHAPSKAADVNSQANLESGRSQPSRQDVMSQLSSTSCFHLFLWRRGGSLRRKQCMRIKIQFDTISDISNLAVIATQDSGSDYDIFSGSSSSDSESIDGSSGSDA